MAKGAEGASVPRSAATAARARPPRARARAPQPHAAGLSPVQASSGSWPASRSGSRQKPPCGSGTSDAHRARECECFTGANDVWLRKRLQEGAFRGDKALRVALHERTGGDWSEFESEEASQDPGSSRRGELQRARSSGTAAAAARGPGATKRVSNILYDVEFVYALTIQDRAIHDLDESEPEGEEGEEEAELARSPARPPRRARARVSSTLPPV